MFVCTMTVPLIAGESGIAYGGVVLIKLCILICLCSGCFPDWSGQAVPRNDA